MRFPTRSLLPVVALALATTSCLSDPVEPVVITECLRCLGGPVAFAAVSANDRALPAFIGPDGATRSGRLLTGASVVIVSPDSLQLVLTTRQVAENGEAGAAVDDTLRAYIRWQDSTLVLSPMGTYPLLLREQASLRSDSSLLLTVEQPLVSSDGAVAVYPVVLEFRRTMLGGSAQP